jgi:acyl-coenzyme A thioesterase PaaI-like protein
MHCNSVNCNLLIYGFFLKALIEKGSPFTSEFLQPKVLALHPGKIKFKISHRAVFIGNSFRPITHGGMISAIIDHCGGFCAWSGLTDINKTVSTVDLRVDFLLPS